MLVVLGVLSVILFTLSVVSLPIAIAAATLETNKLNKTLLIRRRALKNAITVAAAVLFTSISLIIPVLLWVIASWIWTIS